MDQYEIDFCRKQGAYTLPFIRDDERMEIIMVPVGFNGISLNTTQTMKPVYYGRSTNPVWSTSESFVTFSQ